MAASINDKLKKYKSLFSTTLSTGIGTGTSDTITPATVTGLPTDTAITLTIDRVDSSGTATPSKLERIKGIISGGNLISYVRGIDGTTEQVHSAGAVVEMVWNADDWNNAVDHLLVEHGQDGKHTSAVVTTLKATGAEVDTGTEDAKIVTPKAMADSTYIKSGWTPARETWAYASASTITVPSGAASKYAKGDKIRWKQGAGYKYAYIISIADTVLTVAGGSNYTVANDTITDNYYSHASSPIGFPDSFNLTTPTWTSSGTAFANQPSCTATFTIIGNMCNIRISGQAHATSSATGLFYVNFTAGQMPSTSSDTSIGMAMCVSTGIGGFAKTVAGQAAIITVSKYDGTALFTNSQYYGASVSWIF